MERRDFFKLAALTGAAATLDSCGSPDHQLIRFVPEETLVPGIATWKPSLCTLCPAGCGLMVRVMQGEAEVVRKGQLGIIKMGLAKKLEGNPMHPVNRGKLCARGQAGLQVVYHPDRLRGPLKRTGERGSGAFQELSWDDAMKELTSQLSTLHSSGSAGSLAFLTAPLRGQRRELMERFLKAYGAPPPVTYEPLDDTVLRQANLLSFGWPELPTLDLARAELRHLLRRRLPGHLEFSRFSVHRLRRDAARATRGAAADSCRSSPACLKPAPMPTNGFLAVQEQRASSHWESLTSF